MKKSLIEGVIAKEDRLAREIQEKIGVDSVYIPGHVWPVRGKLIGAGEARNSYSVRIMLVGKWPETHEWHQLHNFAGPSGSILMKAMPKQLLDRDFLCLFTTNAVPFVMNERPVTRQEIRNLIQICRPLLEREIELLQPQLIICLGREAARAILDAEVPVVDKASEISEYSLPSGRKCYVMTTVHPAAVLRNEKMFPVLQNSLAIASYSVDSKARIVDPSIATIFPELESPRVMPSSKMLDELKRIKCEVYMLDNLLALDCEWHGHDPRAADAKLLTVQIAPFCVHMDQIGKNTVVFEVRDKPGREEEEAVRYMFDRFKLIGYNLKEDILWLIMTLCSKPEDVLYKFVKTGLESLKNYNMTFYDLMLIQHAMDENVPKGLTALAGRYGIPAYDMEVKAAFKKSEDRRGYGGIDKEILYPYAARDAAVCCPLLKSMLTDEEYIRNYKVVNLEHMANLVLLVMEFFGLPFDRQTMYSIESAYRKKAEELARLLKDEFGEKFNPDSNHHICYVLYGIRTSKSLPGGLKSFHLNPVKKTEKGSPSTDAESLKILINQNPELKALRLLADYKTIKHALTHFLKPDSKSYLGQVSVDGRVRSTFWQTLETGRYSSSGPNVQNISKSAEIDYQRIMGEDYPGSLRSAFSTRKGWKIVQADIVGAEACVMAWMSQDMQMIEDVRRSQLPPDHPEHMDLHTMIACESFGIFLPRMTKDELVNAGKGHLRHAAKRIIFGLSYGRGAEAFQRQLLSEGVDISIDDVQKVIDRLRTRYPGVFAFFEKCEKTAIQNGVLVNMFGRKRRFRILNDMSPETRAHALREARNFIIQSTVADFLSLYLAHLTEAIMRLDRTINPNGDPFYLIRPVLSIHDAVYVECVDDKSVIEAVRILIHEMVKKVPIHPVDIATGEVYESETYYFAMESKVRDSID